MNEPLQEAFHETDRAKLLRALPWLHLMRGFRLATRWQNLALALLGLFLLTAGRWGLSYLPFSGTQRQVISSSGRAIGPFEAVPDSQFPPTWPWEQEFLSPSLPTVRGVIQNGDLPSSLTILAPLGDLVRPTSVLFQRRNTWSDVADAWLHVLLTLLVGSLIGGGITRRVALEFGRSIEPGLRDALRQSGRDLQFTIGAPMISLVGIGLLLFVGRIIAWVGLIPGAGPTLAALGWGLLLIVSLVLALILIGVAVAWPLMIAAHSCEGTDGFDALNRAYNYVFVRPWYALWLLVVSLVYGTVLILFVLGLTGLTLHLSEWIAAGPLSDDTLATITRPAPALVTTEGSLPIPDEASPAAWIGGAWQRGLACLLTAFVYSYFWTAATLIYLLLRKSVDACEFTDIFVPKCRPAADGPPLAGIPAAEQREAAERAATAVPASEPATADDAASEPSSDDADHASENQA